MIEKFSPEEIAILKKELSEMPKDIQKRSLCEKAFKARREIFKERPKYSGIDNWEVENSILNIVDHTLANYEERDKFHKKNGRYRRGIFVNRKLESDYQDMAEDIVDIIRKYYRRNMINNG